MTLKIKPRRHRADRIGGYRSASVKPLVCYTTQCQTVRTDNEPRIEELAAMYAAAEAHGSEFLARRAGLVTSVTDFPRRLDLS